MSKPSSASVTAGAKRSRHAVLPCCWWTSISSRRMPGTPMERPDASRVRLRFGAIGVGDPAQVVLGRRGGRDLPAVVGLDGVGLGVVVEQEPAAADPGRLRLDQAQHGLGGDQRIGGGTAVFQHLAGLLRGERVGRGDRIVRGAHSGHVLAVAGGDLGVGGDVARGGRRTGRRGLRGLRRRGAVFDDRARSGRSGRRVVLATASGQHQDDPCQRGRQLLQ